MLRNNQSAIFTAEAVDKEDVSTWALPDGAIARLGRGCNPNFAFSPEGQLLAIGNIVGLWVYT